MLAELAGPGRPGSTGAAAGRCTPPTSASGILGANAIVGAAAPIAAGAAWAARRAGSDRVVVTFFGDGAVNQGVLLETFNLAALWRVPVVFVCENNGYATSMRVEPRSPARITGRAAAFGIPAATVDGMDPEAVLRRDRRRPSTRARAGGGPTFLECLTYRFDAHHTLEHAARPALPHRRGDRGRPRRATRWTIQGARLAGRRRGPDRRRGRGAARRGGARSPWTAPHPDPAGALDYLYADGLRARAGVA